MGPHRGPYPGRDRPDRSGKQRSLPASIAAAQLTQSTRSGRSAPPPWILSHGGSHRFNYTTSTHPDDQRKRWSSSCSSRGRACRTDGERLTVLVLGHGPPRCSLLRSFERHLRAKNHSERTVGNYVERARLAQGFLEGRGL